MKNVKHGNHDLCVKQTANEPTNKCILNGRSQSMAEMELASHIRRRQQDWKRFGLFKSFGLFKCFGLSKCFGLFTRFGLFKRFFEIAICREVAAVFPPLVPAIFYQRCVVNVGKWWTDICKVSLFPLNCDLYRLIGSKLWFIFVNSV